MQEKTSQEIEQSTDSWLGEAGETEDKSFVPSDQVTLPVGVIKDGQNYRNLVIDEMSGIDDHLVSGKKSGNNGAKALSLVICRSTQEVEGLLPRKQDSEKLFDREFARRMTQPDRDYLITRIFMLSGNNHAIMAGRCPRCGDVWEESVLLSDLPVVSWPEDKPRELDFELEVGFKEMKNGKAVFHKKGKIRFPTGKEQELTGQMDDQASIMDAMIAACVTKVGTLEHIDQEQAKRLKRRDRELLMSVIQNELPGLKQWKDVRCNCGNTLQITLDLASFFGGRRRRMKK